MKASEFTTSNAGNEEDTVGFCGKCEVVEGDFKCTCDEIFCDPCFQRHIERLPKHQKVSSGQKILRKAWSWVSGTFNVLLDMATRSEYFKKKDQMVKWLGLYIESSKSGRIARIIETARCTELAENWATASANSAKRQFPSIVSFIGETGVGKSTLIRTLIWRAAGDKGIPIETVEAPVPGCSAGPSAFIPTTGEVNLYTDPAIFGTTTPQFYADCEGFLGSEPACAQHHNGWYRLGRKYLIRGKSGKTVDRSIAVKEIYPRFLYIFSDVICLVTRNPKAWAKTALKLLE